MPFREAASWGHLGVRYLKSTRRRPRPVFLRARHGPAIALRHNARAQLRANITIASEASHHSSPVGCSAMLAGPPEHRHLALQPRAQGVALRLQIEASLQVEPEPLTRAEVARQPERRVRRDPALAVDDLVDPPRRHADVLRQAVL